MNISRVANKKYTLMVVNNEGAAPISEGAGVRNATFATYA